jgi:H+/gluconate symporter-like permease
VLVSMSAVLLLGLLIWFLLRIRYLRWAEFLLCTVFGFLLAKTAAEPLVQSALDGVGGFLGQLRF